MTTRSQPQGSRFREGIRMTQIYSLAGPFALQRHADDSHVAGCRVYTITGGSFDVTTTRLPAALQNRDDCRTNSTLRMATECTAVSFRRLPSSAVAYARPKRRRMTGSQPCGRIQMTQMHASGGFLTQRGDTSKCRRVPVGGAGDPRLTLRGARAFQRRVPCPLGNARSRGRLQGVAWVLCWVDDVCA